MKVVRSKSPCFVCKKTERTVRAKGNGFELTLCWEHAYEHVPEEQKKTKKPVVQT